MPNLKDRLEFRSRADDANGRPAGAFVARFQLWAAMDYQRGSETAVSSRMEGNQPALILVRDTPRARQISPAFCAVVQGQGPRAGEVFNIKGVAPAKEAGYFNLIAVSGGAAG